MTTKETAEALCVSESTIQRHAKELGLTENGKQTNLDEKAVTLIKTKIERSGRTDLRNVAELPNVSTELEMMILDAKVSEWKTRRIEELQKSLEVAKEKIAIDAPKVDFYNAVTDSTDAIEMKDAAKALNISGYGRNRLFQFLRDNKILMGNNTPYQSFIDRGFFRVIETQYQTATGDTHINLKTVVYQRGLDFIRKAIEAVK